MALIDRKKDFLIAAINDISNYIRFVDTKISLILTVCGVLFTASISLRTEIIKICAINSNAISLFYILTLLVIISFTIVLFCSIKVLTLRVGNLSYESLWFLNANNNRDFSDYYNKIMTMTNKEIIKNLSAELFKLNQIYACKLKWVKHTICAFSVFLILYFIFILAVFLIHG